MKKAEEKVETEKLKNMCILVVCQPLGPDMNFGLCG
jgi:hypothetical protein